MTEVDNRALRRALQIERCTRKLLTRKLRGLMKPAEYDEFLRICRSEALARCDVPKAANATATSTGDDQAAKQSATELMSTGVGSVVSGA